MKRSESKKLTMNSTIEEVYKTPIGHDVLRKVLLQLGLPVAVIKNPISRSLTLEGISGIIGDRLGKGFFEAILTLINTEPDRVPAYKGPVKKAWWKEAVFYQIYPRSFRDSNGDGIGDLNGIIEKLDYLKELGVDALWLSPIYDSPNDDNGYDIRDYRKIMKEFGTMKDFDRLLSEVHKRGMRLIMDLVVNHTSDEHKWFKKAIEDPDSEYGKYYFIKEGSDKRPSNWTSFFSGPAWDKYGDKELWALHLFSKKQPDLNWDNPKVRDEVADLVNFWLDKGVDGFRMDVITYISKDNLNDGNEAIGQLFGFTGIEHYVSGPHLHEHLRELHERAFAPHNAFSVGETPGVGIEMAKLLTSEERGEIDMLFSFDHLETPGHERFDDYKYDLNYYRDYIIYWMEHYGNGCWMSLFYNNHDNPRMASKVDPNGTNRAAVQRLLAVMQLTLKGTPFIYQGDEMGLVNYCFESMNDIHDIESRNKYKELCDKGMSPKKAFDVIKAGTRDHAREPLPWYDRLENVPEHLIQLPNAAIHDVYKKLIALRRRHNALIYGGFRVIEDSKDRFVYERYDRKESFVIDCNLSDKAIRGVFYKKGYKRIYAPLYKRNRADILLPYEVRIWKKNL